MVNLLSNVAIQDASNTSNIVYLDNIMTGVDGAATFGYSITPTALQVNDNQRQQYKHDHQLDIRVLRASGADLTKLQAIAGGSGRVNVAALTIDDSIFLWGATPDVTKPVLTYKPQHDEVIADQILLTETTPIGYCLGDSGEEYPVFAGDNLLAKYQKGTFTRGGALYQNGFADGDAIEDYKNGLYEILGGTIVETFPIYFPFPGKEFTAGFTVDLLGPTPSLQTEMTVRFIDAAGNLISGSTVTITATAAGTFTETDTIPAGTVFIEINIEETVAAEIGYKDVFFSLNKQQYTPF